MKIPVLIDSLNFNDERGSIVKPSLVLPGNKKIKFSDIYISKSKKYVFRGLHYQESPFQQEKLFTPITGCIIIYCIKINDNSKIIEFTMKPEKSKTLYVPKGWATGMLAIEDENSILYCSPQHYQPSAEKGISYSKITNLALDIGDLLVSKKDQNW